MGSWDRYKRTSGFVSFAEIGDSVEGTIVSVDFGPYGFDDVECPRLIIEQDDGTSVTLTAGQRVLQSELAEKEPEPGDRIKIQYSGNGEGKPGRAPAKLFEVVVERGAEVKAEDLA